MFFLLVRIGLLLLLETIAIIILVVKRKKMKVGIIILLLCLPLVIHTFSYYVKFEAPFLRFDTVEGALSYSILNGNVEEMYETDECVFIIYSGFEQAIALGTINKYEDKFGMLDETAEIINYKFIKTDADIQNKEVFVPYSVYNKKANQSLLQISQNYGFGTVDQKNTCITTKDGINFTKIVYQKNEMNNMLYNKIVKGKVEEKHVIVIREKEFQLEYS